MYYSGLEATIPSAKTAPDSIKNYLADVEKRLATGEAKEHSYRPALQALIESLDSSVMAINDGKQIACGAPDFRLLRKGLLAGMIEAKDIDADLDEESKSDQLKRYLKGPGNLVLTDYLEFRWYVNGEFRASARLAQVSNKKKLLPDPKGATDTEALLRAFLKQDVPTVSSPKELAERMASLAQMIRAAIQRALKTEEEGGTLHEQLKGFRQVLLHDLTVEQFADMYAQTIAYGLFAAKCNVNLGEEFTREKAAHVLPKTNPFLRKMFGHIAGPELDNRITWAVDDLVSVLNHTQIHLILKDFGKRTRQEDPVVHFYETFLAAYDPKMREARGVYYTPEPVVSYIVRSVDQILKNEFGLKDGLADASTIRLKSKAKGKRSEEFESHRVLVLDPAVGTGTFLHGVVDQIHEHQVKKGQKGAWSSYVSEHLLPRIFGFELLMAPYTVAHMKLGLQLKQLDYDFKENERLGIYLTNTLEEAHAQAGLPLFAKEIAEEANAASRIKRDLPIMVVLGNPPYSGHSANVGQWISNLLRGKDISTDTATGNYFEVDGEPLGEKNPKWLNDDYVKFIRFAQWRIEQTGSGILAFISNNGYLDNPTFRGMRQSLMRTFDEIHILDLHGSSKKKEKSPDGSKDENVFDIQQGVAIGIFVKRGTSEGNAAVSHANLWGERERFKEKQLIGGKYFSLLNSRIDMESWIALEPEAPNYLFVPQDTTLRREYELGMKVNEIFPLTLLGPNSHRDDFAISFTESDARTRIRDFFDPEKSDEEIREKFDLPDNRDWNLHEARKSRVPLPVPVRCIYRPFDFRYMLYGSYAFDYHRPEINDQLLRENVALISTRQTKEAFSVFCSSLPAGQHKLATPYDGSYLSPLYLYPDPDNRNLFGQEERMTNLSPEFIEVIEKKLGVKYSTNESSSNKRPEMGPADLFQYVYAVLHSPGYRQRFGDFLRIDFPRVPVTSDWGQFQTLSRLGGELLSLHLLKWPGLDRPITSYPISGSNEIERTKIKHVAAGTTEPGGGRPLEAGRVYINLEQYFEGVSAEIWGMQIGGYRVCEKWLKDRDGRSLTYDDIQHYQKMITALAETRRIMDEIDKTIPTWPIK